MRRKLWVIPLLLAAGLAGCLEPYRVHVDGAVLARSSLPWRETDRGASDGGLLGTKQVQVDYDIAAGQGAPPAHVEVYGLRSPSDPGTTLLMNRSQEALHAYTARYGLVVDNAQDRYGGRTWASGVRTEWFSEEGKAVSSGLFTRNYRVRLVAEVGHDAHSSTSIVALAVAQVEVSRQCPLVGDCSPSTDERSWDGIVGDPDGRVAGSVSATGLLENLVSHP